VIVLDDSGYEKYEMKLRSTMILVLYMKDERYEVKVLDVAYDLI
jgi:hypothetical protein